MKNLRVLITFGFVLGAGGLVACGGGDSGESCILDTDCAQGLVCEGDTCGERICDSAQDCGLESRVCVLINDKKVCTARECSQDKPCDDANMECLNGICIAKDMPDTVDADIPLGEVPPGEDVTVGDTPGETPTPVTVGDCKPCADKSECDAGYFCTSVGGGKFCLKGCGTDGDCNSGYICYQASSEGLQCLPVSYNCVQCAYDGCDAGKCCDLVSGNCEDCLGECEKCTYDFQCAAGFRCYKTAGNPTGNCVAECGDSGSCADPAKFTCGDNGKGVQLCVPVDDESCGTSCPAEKPFALPDGTCVECLNSTHCADPTPVCDQTSHSCGDQQCGGGSYKCSDDQCHQCCEDAHCVGLGGTDKCVDFQCEGVVDNCGNTCADPYPKCANVGGTWQCVQCAVDADCTVGDCVCSQQSFICSDPITGQACGGTSGSECQSLCTTPADCPPGAAGETMDCHNTGVCFNPAGGCDGLTSCCGPNQQCFDLMSLFFGGLGGIMPGMPITNGYCSCSADGDCLGGEPCAGMDMLCVIPIISDMICPGGALPAGVPAKMCFDISSLLGGILP